MSLYTIGIELTSACNLECLHCLRDFSRPNAFFSVGLLDRLCQDAKTFGVREISFTGGEPTLHPKFRDIVDLVVSHGFSFSFVTNGATFPHIASLFADEARRKALSRVCFSLDGAVEKTHDFNRGKGSYRQVMEAVAQCKGLGLPVMLQMSVGTFNRHEVEAMALLASHLEATELYYSHMMPTRKNVEKGLLLSPEECLRVEDEVRRLQQAMKLPIFLSVGHYCSSPFYQCVAFQMNRINVDYLGNLTMCCQISNYQGWGSGNGLPDTAADLQGTPLADALQKLVELIGRVQHARIERISQGNLGLRDYFPCFSCALHLGKLGFLEDFPDSPWTDSRGTAAR